MTEYLRTMPRPLLAALALAVGGGCALLLDSVGRLTGL